MIHRNGDTYKITSSKKEKYVSKYKPIKSYGSRFILLLYSNELYLYDIKLDKLENLGLATNKADYDDNFIYNGKEGRVYLMYNNEKIDVTNYYMRNLESTENIKVAEGIEIVSEEEFEMRVYEKTV